MAFDLEMTGIEAKSGINKGRYQVTHVREHGAVGNGSTDDTAAIQAAIDAAGEGGVIEFEASKVYLIRRDLVLNDCTIFGNGAWIKRANAEHSTLSAVAADGASSIQVTDIEALNLEPYDQVLILDGSAPNGGRADEETSVIQSGSVVQSISGSTITFFDPFSVPESLTSEGEFPVGSVVLKVYHQMQTNEKTVIMRDLNFDGNRANNDIHVGWVPNSCIRGFGPGSIIQGCKFKEMPSECLYIDHWCTVTENEAWNLNGSFVHISSTTVQDDKTLKSGSNIISNNRIAGCCQVPFEISRHNAGVFEYSLNPGKLLVEGNYIDGCSQSFIGRTGAASDLTVSGNVVRNCNGILHMTAKQVIIENVVMTGNQFESCLWIFLDGNEGFGCDGVNISGNQFVNTKISLVGAHNVLISDNIFTWEAGFDASSAAASQLQSQDSIIYWKWGQNFTISGNLFDDRKTTADVVTTCISFADNENSKLKTDAETDSVFVRYNRNIRIVDNQMLNFSNGVVHGDSRPNAYSYAFLNFAVSGNTIALRASTSGIGVRTIPNMLVEGNLITGDAEHGIEVLLVGDAAKTSVPGPVIKENTVIGQFDHSIRVGSGDGNLWNGVVVNNLTDVAVEDLDSAGNTVDGNMRIHKTGLTYPQQPARANEEWY